MKRKEVQQLFSRGQQLQVEEALEGALQQDLQTLENSLSRMEQSTDSQEQSLEVRLCIHRHLWQRRSLYNTRPPAKVTLAAWQQHSDQQEAVQTFVLRARSSMDRELNFSSPESLEVELDQARVSPRVHRRSGKPSAARLTCSRLSGAAEAE